MAKTPWFYFFPSDWLGSNRRACMSLEQQGAYINLLARQWSEPTCSLPDDDKVLAALSEMKEGWLKGGSQLVRECFPPHPSLRGQIANPKLLELRAERDEWIEKSSEGGRKSAAARKKGQKKGHKKGGLRVVQGKGVPNGNSPSPSPSPNIEVLNSTSCDAPLESSPTVDGKDEKSSEFSFPLKTGKLWDLPQRKYEEYVATYGDHMDVSFQLRKAKEWLMVNKPKRKTASGMKRFLTGWLNRQSDKSPITPHSPPQRPDGRVYD